MFQHRRFRNRIYIIPKGTVIPDTMALLQDKRIATDWKTFYLVTREPCTPEISEQNTVDFVVRNETRLCFECVNRPTPQLFTYNSEE